MSDTTKFTPGPWDVCVWADSRDPVEQFREHLSHGSGQIWGAWVPGHPQTRGAHPAPEHAVMSAITGNGTASKANAYLIAAAPDLYAALESMLDECANALCDDRKHAAAWAALRKARGDS